MKPILLVTFFLSILFTSLSVFGQEESQLIIIGGGASGTSAGIQVTRIGVKTVILEESSWLGRMKTAAGALAGMGILDQ